MCTKFESVELQFYAMLADSHVIRADTKVDGLATKIFRRIFPYGTVARHWLYSLAFACYIERSDMLLRRMYGVSGADVYARLSEFSRAVTGANWLAPAKEDPETALAMA